MNKYILTALSLFLLFSCNNDDTEDIIKLDSGDLMRINVESNYFDLYDSEEIRMYAIITSNEGEVLYFSELTEGTDITIPKPETFNDETFTYTEVLKDHHSSNDPSNYWLRTFLDVKPRAINYSISHVNFNGEVISKDVAFENCPPNSSISIGFERWENFSETNFTEEVEFYENSDDMYVFVQTFNETGDDFQYKFIADLKDLNQPIDLSEMQSNVIRYNPLPPEGYDEFSTFLGSGLLGDSPNDYRANIYFPNTNLTDGLVFVPLTGPIENYNISLVYENEAENEERWESIITKELPDQIEYYNLDFDYTFADLDQLEFEITGTYDGYWIRNIKSNESGRYTWDIHGYTSKPIQFPSFPTNSDGLDQISIETFLTANGGRSFITVADFDHTDGYEDYLDRRFTVDFKDFFHGYSRSQSYRTWFE